MITIICGAPGAGKTALMTYFALEYLNYDVDYMICLDKIAQYNQQGFNLSTPQHLVFSDWKIACNSQTLGACESYFCNGFYVGMPNNQHRTMFLPPYAKVFLSEAQRYYDSRKYESLSDFVSQLYEQHRHWGMQIFLDCQRPTLVDLNIRGLATRILYVTSLKHNIDTYGRIVSSTWECKQFGNIYDFDNFLQNAKTDIGEPVEFPYSNKVIASQPLQFRDTPKFANVTNYRVVKDKSVVQFPCDIFASYNSTNKESAFLRGRQRCDFSLYTHPLDDAYITDLDDIYSFEAPRTFYKLKDKDTKNLEKGKVLTI